MQQEVQIGNLQRRWISLRVRLRLTVCEKALA
jgi:hypothetical protein